MCAIVCMQFGTKARRSCEQQLFNSSCLVIMLLTMDTYILFDFVPIVFFLV